jgi:Sugar (and other) transporter
MKIIDKTSSPTADSVLVSAASTTVGTPIRRRRQNHHMKHMQEDDEDDESENGSIKMNHHSDDDKSPNHSFDYDDDHSEKHTNGSRHYANSHGTTTRPLESRTKGNNKRSPKQRRKRDGTYSAIQQDMDEHEIIMEEKDGIMILVNDRLDLNHNLDPIIGGIELDSEYDASKSNKMGQTIAGIVGNVLEWYDFAVFGYLSDILGQVFFPPNQTGHKATMESFIVFGSAFLMRPIGGIVLGYIGDTYGRKVALIISIFVMAIPTFAMGCLPSYERAGHVATILLIIIRLFQGLSVGGQLMSSLVFTLENQPRDQWGFYGSFVMAAANL